MLERTPYLLRFVDEMTKINNGRAFFSTPERLGEYILVDFVNQKRRTRRAHRASYGGICSGYDPASARVDRSCAREALALRSNLPCRSWPCD